MPSKNIDICCIYSIEDYATLRAPLIDPLQIPFGISYVATILKNNGYNVDLLVLTHDSDLEVVMTDYAKENYPFLFCLTSVASEFPFICKVCKIIKKRFPSTYIAVGGSHTSLFPDYSIKQPHIDCVCIGEGELAMLALASSIKQNVRITSINNLWIKDKLSGVVEKNKTANFLEDLDSLPFIDRQMWQPWISNINSPYSILVGRGCPYRCSYCSNHKLSGVADGRYLRYRSPDNVIAEIKYILISNPSAESIYFEVETLGFDHKYDEDFLKKLRFYNFSLRKPLSFGCNLTLTKEISQSEALLEKFKAANFKFLNIGLESGSERIRREVLNRPYYSNESIIRFCASAKKFNIEIHMYVLLGIPGENYLDFKETIDCVRKCDPGKVSLSIYYPYPGTTLYDAVRKKKYLKTDIAEVRLERKLPRLDLPDFSKKEIIKDYILFPYFVFKGNTPLYKISLLVIKNLLNTNYKLNRIYRLLTENIFFRKKKLKLIRLFFGD